MIHMMIVVTRLWQTANFHSIVPAGLEDVIICISLEMKDCITIFRDSYHKFNAVAEFLLFSLFSVFSMLSFFSVFPMPSLSFFSFFLTLRIQRLYYHRVRLYLG